MGETEAQAALRELQEETGLTARLDTGIRSVIEYPVGACGHKQVVIFPGQVSGTPSVRQGEIARYQWVSEAELAQHLFPDSATACHKLIQNLR